jgi:FAD/FMN-containing dehydrogenase
MSTISSTTPPSITTEEFRAFRLRVKGQVLMPCDEGYDEARALHNTRIDHKPAIIVRVADASDVSRAVRFARQQSLTLGVRSGGHSIAGQSVVDGGLVIDMSALDDVRIDAEAKVAWVQPGALAGRVADETQAFGLAIPFGDAGSVGVGGITLGGGVGFLVRKHGLTIDHVAGVEMVTADGQIVHASADENPELFWGVRGGGGNFGIVTGFQFDLVEVGTILGGMLAFPATPEVIKRYAEVSLQLPEELTSITMVLKAPPLPFVPAEAVGQPVLAAIVCYTGNLDEGARAVDTLRAIGTPVVDMIQPMPYSAIYNLTADMTLPGRVSIRSAFVPEIGDDLSSRILEQVVQAPAPLGAVQIRPLGGAMARVDPTETAFAHRDANFMLMILAQWEDRAEDTAHDAWVQQAWQAIQPYARGVYVNFLGDEGKARIGEAYPGHTAERLALLKRGYDPENVFRGNQNIAPMEAVASRAA